MSGTANAKLVFGPSDAGLKGWKKRKKKQGVPGRQGVDTRQILPVEHIRYNSCTYDVRVGGAIFVTYSKNK